MIYPLYNATMKQIGVFDLGKIDENEFANRVGCKNSTVFHGRFLVRNTQLIPSRRGIDITYSSSIGRLDGEIPKMARVIQLWNLEDEVAHFYALDNGQYVAYVSEDDVLNESLDPEAADVRIPLTVAVTLAALKIPNALGAAMKERLAREGE